MSFESLKQSLSSEMSISELLNSPVLSCCCSLLTMVFSALFSSPLFVVSLLISLPTFVSFAVATFVVSVRTFSLVTIAGLFTVERLLGTSSIPELDLSSVSVSVSPVVL